MVKAEEDHRFSLHVSLVAVTRKDDSVITNVIFGILLEKDTMLPILANTYISGFQDYRAEHADELNKISSDLYESVEEYFTSTDEIFRKLIEKQYKFIATFWAYGTDVEKLCGHTITHFDQYFQTVRDSQREMRIQALDLLQNFDGW